MKVFSKFKVLGVALATLVAVGITACGGGDGASGGDSAASMSDEGDKLYLDWLKNRDKVKGKSLILVKVVRTEGKVNSELTTGELDKVIKASRIMRTYKVKNEYKPEREWEHLNVFEHFMTFTGYIPSGAEKMATPRCAYTSGTNYYSLSTIKPFKDDGGGLQNKEISTGRMGIIHAPNNLLRCYFNESLWGSFTFEQ